MQGQVLKIDKKPSRYGGEVYVVYIKTFDEGSFKCWIDPKNRNYSKWREIIARGKGTILRNLTVLNKEKHLVDADSDVRILKDNFKSSEEELPFSNIPHGYNGNGDRL